MVKRNPRRPSSAAPTSRPRRIAGSSGPTSPEGTDPVETPVEGEGDTAADPPHVETEPEAGTEPELESDPEPEESDPEPEPEPEPQFYQPTSEASDDPGFVGSARTTRILLVAIAVMAVLALAGGIFLWVHDEPESASATDDPSTISADEETPVRISGEDAQVAVAAAAQAASTIVATSYQDYDAQVDEAAELMTPAFADEYRQTAAEVEDAIISGKTEVEAEIVAQGVVRADQEQVQALVFLNMFTTKDGKEAVATPYRVLVTVVNTDQGWLVSNLDTQ